MNSLPTRWTLPPSLGGPEPAATPEPSRSLEMIGRVRRPWIWLATAAAMLLGLAWAAQTPKQAAPVDLAADLPPGALMTLESPDFAALLAPWNRSPEQKAWLASANYSVFSNSRLFGGLSDAQSAFAGAAGTEVDGGFLGQVAGRESIFAWYDIGKLEFLYITHLTPGRAARVDLLRQRGKFSRREAGGTAFYIRTGAAGDSGDADAGDTSGTTSDTQPRTVAFATRGDWLLLATREDLMANALILMRAANGANRPASMATEGWYTAAAGLDTRPRGTLHMMLDLAQVTRTPQFRSYWLQRNVTELRGFRAAAVDLYNEPNGLREERVLLPNSTAADSSTPAANAGLEALERWVPERAGVFRAIAQPSGAYALTALQDRLLIRGPANAAVSTNAPTTDLNVADAGSSSDLETRIDMPAPVDSGANGAAELESLLKSTPLHGMLTMSRTDTPPAGQLFVPMNSAVVLEADSPWNRDRLAGALLAAMRSRLTAARSTLTWQPGEGNTLRMNDAEPFTLFVEGNVAVVATDPALMKDILTHRGRAAGQPPSTGTIVKIAEFRHRQEREGFHRIMTALDSDSAPASTNSSTGGKTPRVFRDSLGSLSDSFQAFTTERLVETHDAGVVHQTVVYTIAR